MTEPNDIFRHDIKPTDHGLPEGTPIIDLEGLTAADGQTQHNVIEALFASPMLVTSLQPDRPYSGQPHRHDGAVGAVELTVTVRDVFDAFVIAMFKSSGLPVSKYPATLHELDTKMDPEAVVANMLPLLRARANVVHDYGGKKVVTPDTCIFCGNEWPDICTLHHLGDQRHAANK